MILQRCASKDDLSRLLSAQTAVLMSLSDELAISEQSVQALSVIATCLERIRGGGSDVDADCLAALLGWIQRVRKEREGGLLYDK